MIHVEKRTVGVILGTIFVLILLFGMCWALSLLSLVPLWVACSIVFGLIGFVTLFVAAVLLILGD